MRCFASSHSPLPFRRLSAGLSGRSLASACIFIVLVLGTDALQHSVLKFPPKRSYFLHNTRRCSSSSTALLSLKSFIEDEEDPRRKLMTAALTKMNDVSNPAFVSSLQGRGISSVEVKPSSIKGAGLGLFATKSIKAGTVISYYPAHFLGVEMGDSTIRVCLDPETGQASLRKDDESEESSAGSNSDFVHHLLGSRPLLQTSAASEFGGGTLFIDVDRDRPDSPGWVSHRINDGATVTANDEDGVLSYYASSRRAKNCVHIPFGPAPVLATVTTKKVKKGQELFTTYGCAYWLEILVSSTGEKPTGISTEPILEQAKEVARDVFQNMQSAAVMNANDIEAFNAAFDKE